MQLDNDFEKICCWSMLVNLEQGTVLSMRIALCVLLVACGGTQRKLNSTDVQGSDEEAPSQQCVPSIVSTAISFEKLEQKTTVRRITEDEFESLEEVALGAGVGTNVNHSLAISDGNIAVSISGCEEEECAGGVAVLRRTANNSYEILASDYLPENSDFGVTEEFVFVSDLIGDQALEFGIVYTIDREDGEEQVFAVLYSLPKLVTLWEVQLSPVGDDCVRTVHRADLNCDDRGDLVVQTHCRGILSDTVEFLSGG